MSETSNVGVYKKILASGPFASRSWNDSDHHTTKTKALTVKIKCVSSQQQNNKRPGTNLQNLLYTTTSVKYRPESFDHHIHHHSTKTFSHLITKTYTKMSTTNKSRIVCCVGDIHGYISKLQSLWSNLEISITPSEFESAQIIFLGDYCDRGPDTKKVLDFLISLPSKYPKQSHVFLCGNHDLAFGAFLGVLPSPVDGSMFSETWREYEMSEGREGWYKGEGYENMHLQGRRWGGRMSGFNHAKGTEYKGSIYDAGPTFESYGVPHGSADLVKAVPDEHKKFLADLVWVHEEEDVCIETKDGPKNCRLIAVHAGLEKSKGVEEQINYLKAKDTRISKVEALSGRKNVWNIPEELTKAPTIVVSGHHGKVYIEDFRLIIDEGGGMEANPIAAFVLPSRKMHPGMKLIFCDIHTPLEEEPLSRIDP